MNPSPNPSGQQDPSWITDNWDHTANSNSQYPAGTARQEWDWENQMLLVQNHPATEASERKPQLLPLPTATLCSNSRPYVANYSTSAVPSSFSQQHNSFNVRSYGGIEGYQAGASHPGYVYGHTTPSDLNAELRSYDQRRRFLGMHMLDTEQHKNVLEFVKREDMYSLEPHARIGLNLGGRTYFSAEDSARLGKRTRMNALGTHAPMCQVQGCTADLSKAKHYHRRHKVCDIHSKAPNVIANGQTQRFCQQCSRFHQLSEFDDTKRSCRKRLADHNRRRRKPQHSAVATISEPFKTEDQSTNIRAVEGDHKPMLLHMQKGGGSPTVSITDRDSVSSGATRLQSPLIRAQAIPSSEVQALVLSVVSRTPSSTHSTRHSSGTQESMYQQYLPGPSLSLSSAGVSAQTQQQHHNSSSVHNYSSIEHSVPWLASGSCSRSTLVQARALQAFPPSRENQHMQVGSDSVPQYLLQLPGQAATTREQLGRLGLQNVQDSTIDGHQMLALIENPAQQQQLTSSVDDVKPLGQHSEIQRSSFGSSFYDSSSSIG